MAGLRTRAKVVFVPREAAPLFTPGRQVILARNLKVWDDRMVASARDRLAWTLLHAVGWLSARRAAHIIAVSAVIARRLPTATSGRVSVVHHGCDLALNRDGWRHDAAETLEVVTVGAIDAHKRLGVVVEAVAELARLHPDTRLCIWGPVVDRAEARRLRAQGEHVLGYDPLMGPASPQRRAEILAAADVLAMGSSFESFGLPLVEAMRTGTLVWAPQSALLAELCGAAAVGYEEGSAGSAADALAASLPQAAAIVAAGLDRSLEFNWDRCAEQTLTQLRAVARG
jgi:glycosyltransferase involved in cell wall biosynthesis